MNTAERTELFSSAANIEALTPAFQELLENKEALAAFLQTTLDGFVQNPAKLADESGRRLLSCVFLLVGESASKEFYPQIMRVITSEAFGANVTRDEWLSSDISRLLGIISPDDAMDEILSWLLKASTAQVVAEQMLLTLSCRWIARRDSDAAFMATIKRILSEIPKGLVQFEIAMALVINAVAVGGDLLKTQLFAFYREHEKVLSDRFAEKNLQSFFDLGKQRIKNMLTGNYMGGYGPLPVELNRLVNYAEVTKGDDEPTTLKSLPPITRDRPKIGRNEPCPCGSGKKYKHCCGR